MKNLKHAFIKTSLSLMLIANLPIDSFAISPILRPYQSVRALGMGNVRYTTGLYEENFFANPARVTANPGNRFQLPKLSVEVGTNSMDTLNSLTSSNGDGLSQFADSVGDPLSARFQLLFPAFYSNDTFGSKWSFGVGGFLSAQTILLASQYGTVEAPTLFAAGVPFTLGRKLLEEDRLSVGITVHPQFRGSSSQQGLGLQDFFSGKNLDDSIKGGNGFGLDFDLGSTFRPHWGLWGFEYQLAFAINHVMGGKFNASRPIKDWNGDPMPTPRSFNFGASAVKKDFYFLDQFLYAIEFTDIGNNKNGSIYRTLHIGTEAKYSVLAARLGVNQGYFTGGFGVDLKFFEINFATYGEELGLNPGTLQDRRYAVDLSFHI